MKKLLALTLLLSLSGCESYYANDGHRDRDDRYRHEDRRDRDDRRDHDDRRDRDGDRDHNRYQ